MGTGSHTVSAVHRDAGQRPAGDLYSHRGEPDIDPDNPSEGGQTPDSATRGFNINQTGIGHPGHPAGLLHQPVRPVLRVLRCDQVIAGRLCPSTAAPPHAKDHSLRPPVRKSRDAENAVAAGQPEYVVTKT
jgi:hypothetical protein